MKVPVLQMSKPLGELNQLAELLELNEPGERIGQSERPDGKHSLEKQNAEALMYK